MDAQIENLPKKLFVAWELGFSRRVQEMDLEPFRLLNDAECVARYRRGLLAVYRVEREKMAKQFLTQRTCCLFASPWNARAHTEATLGKFVLKTHGLGIESFFTSAPKAAQYRGSVLDLDKKPLQVDRAMQGTGQLWHCSCFRLPRILLDIINNQAEKVAMITNIGFDTKSKLEGEFK
ncbi:hypothetical protein F66182_1422 [Fusarium sp. NRRL 66182]|nr:hypothetical protein F66182_1422 [Fusarium sp. NRRL 66182]